MGKPSMEENILLLFFEQPTRHWHFKDIKAKVPIADNKISRWLKIFRAQNLITRVKPKKRMPYYISNCEDPNYQNKKRIFALKKLYETGFLNHLSALKKAKTVIIFGSFVRWDWHKDSDIDLFIYGDPEGLDAAKYWPKLHKQVQTHAFQNLKQIKKIRSGLLKNVLKGYLVKGSMDELIGVLS